MQLVLGALPGGAVQHTAAMRPSVLNPLFAAITTLPGIGDKVARLYRRLLGREDTPRVVDLVFHLPTGAVDRRARPVLRDVVPGTVVTVAVTVDRHRPPPPNRPRAALSHLCQRRHRQPRHHLFQRPQGLHRSAAAGGPAPHRVGHHGALRRHAADGASRFRGRRGRRSRACPRSSRSIRSPRG